MMLAAIAVARLAGALGLMVPATTRAAAYALILLLIVMLPANLYAARIGHKIAGRPHTRLIFRVPLPGLWIMLLWWSVRPT